MRTSVLLLISVFSLSGCSLFQRSPETDPQMMPPGTALHVPEEEAEEPTADANVEGEVAKLNTKIEALETKLAVLTHAFENYQAKKSQPEINAVQNAAPPEPPSLAVPVVEPREPIHVKQISAAPAPPARGSSVIETQFRKAMTEFQQGRYREAAQQFSAMSQEHQNHLLSSHALYWAGEAHARVQQWSSAIESWELIEKDYPTSTYVPEALAGLAKAHEVQGDVAKSRTYRETLTRAFPNSPVALAAATSGVSAEPEAGNAQDSSEESEE